MFNHERFQNEVESRGFSFNELDRAIGKKPGMAYKYASQGLTPKPDLLFRYLRAIGMTKEEILQERFADWYSLD